MAPGPGGRPRQAKAQAGGGLGGAERRDAERGCVLFSFRTGSIQLVPPRLYYKILSIQIVKAYYEMRRKRIVMVNPETQSVLYY